MACTKPTTNPDTKNEEDPKTEGVITEGTWVIENADLPTASLRNNYSKMEFTVDENQNYAWNWVKKDGSALLFEGYIFEEKI